MMYTYPIKIEDRKRRTKVSPTFKQAAIGVTWPFQAKTRALLIDASLMQSFGASDDDKLGKKF